MHGACMSSSACSTHLLLHLTHLLSHLFHFWKRFLWLGCFAVFFSPSDSELFCMSLLMSSSFLIGVRHLLFFSSASFFLLFVPYVFAEIFELFVPADPVCLWDPGSVLSSDSLERSSCFFASSLVCQCSLRVFVRTPFFEKLDGAFEFFLDFYCRFHLPELFLHLILVDVLHQQLLQFFHEALQFRVMSWFMSACNCCCFCRMSSLVFLYSVLPCFLLVLRS